MRNFGVHSEVGKLRTVMVCRPALAHQRLTPGNCHELLFDDVIWVHEAQKDHYDFVLKMQERGVEVLDLHDLLAETLDVKEGRNFVLDRLITANSVGVQNAPSCGPGWTNMPASSLRHLDRRNRDLRSSRRARKDDDGRGLRRRRVHPAADTEHAVPARSVLLDLRRRHLQPDVLAGAEAGDPAAAGRLQVPSGVQGRRLQDLVGRCDEPSANASMEGGDVMPIGNGVVLIGLGSARRIRPWDRWRRSCSATRRRRA